MVASGQDPAEVTKTALLAELVRSEMRRTNAEFLTAQTLGLLSLAEARISALETTLAGYQSAELQTQLPTE